MISVLDTHLKGEGTGWLVGGKCTYADLAFVPWHVLLSYLLGETQIDIEGKYPDYDKWTKRLVERDSVKKILEDRAKAMGK